MILEQHYLGCLSQASYFIGDEHSSTAAVVDPRRDVDEYLQEAESRGLTIRHILLTHFHADFASGHLELREKTGATIHVGTGAAPSYDHAILGDGETVEFGKVRLTALWTPGHTPESTCFLVHDLSHPHDRPYAVLTGDTLFIGDVGRPDLMASVGVTAEELAGRLYDSLRDKLLTLPDETVLYPGHGAGSACGKNLSTETSCTIGRQRAMNYALQPMPRNEFIRIVTAGQPAAPRYFSHDARFNRESHPVLGEIVRDALTPLAVDQVLDLQKAGITVLDVRSPDLFAESHMVGSVNIGLDGRFASWAGTVLEPAGEMVIISEPGREKEAIVRLGRIGLDGVRGYLEGGLSALEGRADLMGSFRRYTPGELVSDLESASPPRVLDVRGPSERSGSHIAGSLHVPLPDLIARVKEIPREPEMVIHCARGYRSAIAASLLRREGFRNVSDLTGGMGDWEKAGHPTVTGRPGPAGSDVT